MRAVQINKHTDGNKEKIADQTGGGGQEGRPKNRNHLKVKKKTYYVFMGWELPRKGGVPSPRPKPVAGRDSENKRLV